MAQANLNVRVDEQDNMINNRRKSVIFVYLFDMWYILTILY